MGEQFLSPGLRPSEGSGSSNPGSGLPRRERGCDELRKCGIVFGHAHDVMGEKCMQNNQPEHEFIKNESLRHNPGIEMKVFFASRSV